MNTVTVQVKIDEFVQELCEDERTTFTYTEADKLAELLGLSIPTTVIRGLKARGFQMEERQVPKHFRTIHSNSHDRWFGPGSMPTFGGSGWEQISGFAGQAR